jgi:hypothetical protein
MRARSLKPGFFKNEKLGHLPFSHRLLFAGLWLLADREGRLEERPERIKVEILPFDCRLNVVKIIKALEDDGFLVRYEADGKRYIQIAAFGKHQNPHVREPQSTIPAPGSAPGQAPGEHEAKHQPGTSPAGRTPHSLTPHSLEREGRFAPPALTEVEAHWTGAGLAGDPERFFDYFASKGWRVGNAPMKDWKAAARNWSRREVGPLNQNVGRRPSAHREQYAALGKSEE